MAASSKSALKKKVDFTHVHKLVAAVSLLAFFVIIGAGILAEVRVMTIAYRATLAIILIGVVGRLVIRVLSTYEEMNSGKA